jgi:hypothetical protein
MAKWQKSATKKYPWKLGPQISDYFGQFFNEKTQKMKRKWYFSVFLVKIGLPNFPNFWGNIWTNF